MGLGYLAYRVVKSWMATPFVTRKQDKSGNTQAIDDVMIKDPQCGVYFPKRQGVPLRHEGKSLFFCSKACRDKFIQEKQG